MAERNILVVDDDKDLTNSIKAFMEARNYRVRMAHNGTDGMKEIEKDRPDLIVLDIMMDTDAEGFNLAFKLKESEAYREIPIIILSGFTDHLGAKSKSFEFTLGRDWPASEYIKKPASLTDIEEAVNRLLA
ncbi:MAG: response regulator [Acidobacteriota bacterium]|jgi:DNA-binding response OmpR family regulator|nr:response regulator [Acidobacteriota bacterium]